MDAILTFLFLRLPEAQPLDAARLELLLTGNTLRRRSPEEPSHCKRWRGALRR